MFIRKLILLFAFSSSLGQEIKQNDYRISVLDGLGTLEISKTYLKKLGSEKVFYRMISDDAEFTSFELDFGHSKVKFRANETFRYGSKDFISIASKELVEKGFKAKVLPKKNNLQMVFFFFEEDSLSSAVRIDSSKSKYTFVSGALIKLENNTIVLMNIFNNSQSYTYRHGLLRLSEKILDTFSPGIRKPQINNHVESWNLFTTSNYLNIRVPRNFYCGKGEPNRWQMQFLELKEYVEYSKKESSELHVIIGYNLVYKFNDLEPRLYESKKVNIQLLGNEEKFNFFYNKKDSIYLIETILNADFIKPGLMMGINFTAYSENDLDSLYEVIESMNLSSANGLPMKIQKKSFNNFDISNFKAIYNACLQITIYGTLNDKKQLIDGYKYYYGSDDVLEKIEIYKQGMHIKDSLIAK